MTARSSPHHAATVRAQVRRRGEVHATRAKDIKAREARARRIAREIELFGEPMDWAKMYGFTYEAGIAALQHNSLRDRPKTEEQKASRWRRVWGGT